MTGTATEAPPPPQSCAASGALLVLRVALAGVFLTAAYFKLFAPNGPQSFSEAVQAFKVITPYDNLVTLTTFAVPWAELIAGVCLVLGVWTRAAALVLALLLALFIALVVSAIDRDMTRITCGCFGSFHLLCSKTISWCKVGENAALMLAAVTLVTHGGGRLAVDACCGRCLRE